MSEIFNSVFSLCSGGKEEVDEQLDLVQQEAESLPKIDGRDKSYENLWGLNTYIKKNCKKFPSNFLEFIELYYKGHSIRNYDTDGKVPHVKESEFLSREGIKSFLDSVMLKYRKKNRILRTATAKGMVEMRDGFINLLESAIKKLQMKKIKSLKLKTKLIDYDVFVPHKFPSKCFAVTCGDQNKIHLIDLSTNSIVNSFEHEDEIIESVLYFPVPEEEDKEDLILYTVQGSFSLFGLPLETFSIPEEIGYFLDVESYRDQEEDVYRFSQGKNLKLLPHDNKVIQIFPSKFIVWNPYSGHYHVNKFQDGEQIMGSCFVQPLRSTNYTGCVIVCLEVTTIYKVRDKKKKEEKKKKKRKKRKKKHEQGEFHDFVYGDEDEKRKKKKKKKEKIIMNVRNEIRFFSTSEMKVLPIPVIKEGKVRDGFDIEAGDEDLIGSMATYFEGKEEYLVLGFPKSRMIRCYKIHNVDQKLAAGVKFRLGMTLDLYRCFTLPRHLLEIPFKDKISVGKKKEEKEGFGYLKSMTFLSFPPPHDVMRQKSLFYDEEDYEEEEEGEEEDEEEEEGEGELSDDDDDSDEDDDSEEEEEEESKKKKMKKGMEDSRVWLRNNERNHYVIASFKNSKKIVLLDLKFGIVVYEMESLFGSHYHDLKFMKNELEESTYFMTLSDVNFKKKKNKKKPRRKQKEEKEEVESKQIGKVQNVHIWSIESVWMKFLSNEKKNIFTMCGVLESNEEKRMIETISQEKILLKVTDKTIQKSMKKKKKKNLKKERDLLIFNIDETKRREDEIKTREFVERLQKFFSMLRISFLLAGAEDEKTSDEEDEGEEEEEEEKKKKKKKKGSGKRMRFFVPKLFLLVL